MEGYCEECQKYALLEYYGGRRLCFSCRGLADQSPTANQPIEESIDQNWETNAKLNLFFVIIISFPVIALQLLIYALEADWNTLWYLATLGIFYIAIILIGLGAIRHRKNLNT